MVLIEYWKISWPQSHIRYILKYLAVPYNEVYYEQGDVAEYLGESWFSVKPIVSLGFPKLPQSLIDGELMIK